MMVIALISAGIWIYLLAGRGGFWRSMDIDAPAAALPAPAVWPAVVAVVPARNEAEVIERAVSSLLRQDYPGPLQVVVVDDNSVDETSERALAAARGAGEPGLLRIVNGLPLPRGWTGKLWALHQGIEAAEESAPGFFWLTDADIVYAPDTLRSLVSRAEAGGCAAVSLMALLRCRSFAERLLVPAFIFFFQMLYPFRWVNDPGSATAAAAGGCLLVRREAMAAIGGIRTIGGSLIDDCALAARIKGNGGSIWLGLTRRAQSIRVYGRFADIRAMVARSAYAQLRYSPILLVGTILGLALVYVAPPLIAVFGTTPARYVALAAWAAMALAFVPTLRFYAVPAWWSVGLPAIAACYMGFTLDSALKHVAGRGGSWKGRVQAALDE